MVAALTLLVAACDCGGETEDLDNPDGGGRDGDSFDTFRPDFGFVDGSVPDAIAPDANCRPEIEITPADRVVFSRGDDEESLRVENVGCGVLEVMDVDLVSTQPGTPASNDFILACAPDSCATSLCAPAEPECPSSIEYSIRYVNDDISTVDYGELLLLSNDASEPESLVVLQAEDQPCFPPIPEIVLLTLTATVGVIFEVDGSSSSPGPGDATIVSYSWSFLFRPPGSNSVFMNATSAVASFVPDVSGVYIVALEVMNSCGGTNQRPAQEVINVP